VATTALQKVSLDRVRHHCLCLRTKLLSERLYGLYLTIFSDDSLCNNLCFICEVAIHNSSSSAVAKLQYQCFHLYSWSQRLNDYTIQVQGRQGAEHVWTLYLEQAASLHLSNHIPPTSLSRSSSACAAQCLDRSMKTDDSQMMRLVRIFRWKYSGTSIFD